MLHLYLIPLILALVGLAFYAVLCGADFGAGFWELTAGKGPKAQAVREHPHAANAPVWEANHVWLIFVLTVVWTAYPTPSVRLRPHFRSRSSSPPSGSSFAASPMRSAPGRQAPASSARSTPSSRSHRY